MRSQQRLSYRFSHTILSVLRSIAASRLVVLMNRRPVLALAAAPLTISSSSPAPPAGQTGMRLTKRCASAMSNTRIRIERSGSAAFDPDTATYSRCCSCGTGGRAGSAAAAISRRPKIKCICLLPTGRRDHLESADGHALLAGKLDQQTADIDLLAPVIVGRVGHRIQQVKLLSPERLLGGPRR